MNFIRKTLFALLIVPVFAHSGRAQHQQTVIQLTKRDIRGFYIGMTPEQVCSLIGRKGLCAIPDHWEWSPIRGEAVILRTDGPLNRGWQVSIAFTTPKTFDDLRVAVANQYGLAVIDEFGPSALHDVGS